MEIVENAENPIEIGVQPIVPPERFVIPNNWPACSPKFLVEQLKKLSAENCPDKRVMD